MERQHSGDVVRFRRKTACLKCAVLVQCAWVTAVAKDPAIAQTWTVDRSGGPDSVIAKRNTIVAYSTRVGTSPRDHSPYSATVAKWLGRGGLPLQDWVRGVTSEATALLGEGQQPAFAGAVAPGLCLDGCSR